MATSEREDYHRGPVLSATKLAKYLDCPRAYRIEYVDGMEMPETQPIVIGKIVHDVAESAVRRGLTPDRSDEVAQDMAVLVQSEEERGHKLDAEGVLQLEAASGTWLPWYLWWVQAQETLMLEERFSIDIPGVGLPLMGTIDRVYRTTAGTVISDLKTGKRAPSENDISTDLQLSVYAYAYREISGQAEDALEIVHLPGRKTVATTRSAEYLDRVVNEVIVPAWRGIESGIFPANTHSRYGCGYCRARQYCEIGRER